MALLQTVFLVVLLAAVESKSVSEILLKQQQIGEKLSDLTPRVIGGRAAEYKEFPWMVSLLYKGSFICSSFLITPSVLMTAAHCVVFGREAEPAKYFTGIIDNVKRDGPDTPITFSEVIAHSEYGSNTEYDIAIFKLAEPLTLSDSIKTVCLPSQGSKFDDQIAQAMGWGVTSRGGRESSEVLMTAPLHVPVHTTCQFVYTILGIPVTSRHVCAGSDEERGICFGDSGGPLVALNGTQPVAIGIASFVSYLGCAAPLVPAVYTSTESYVDWVQSSMGDTNGLCIV